MENRSNIRGNAEKYIQTNRIRANTEKCVRLNQRSLKNWFVFACRKSIHHPEVGSHIRRLAYTHTRAGSQAKVGRLECWRPRTRAQLLITIFAVLRSPKWSSVECAQSFWPSVSVLKWMIVCVFHFNSSCRCQKALRLNETNIFFTR